MSAPSGRGVAFFVGLTSNVGPITQHSDIVFDRVVTNVGVAYDTDTGRFTAPVNGTYQFNVIIAAQGRQKVPRNSASYHIHSGASILGGLGEQSPTFVKVRGLTDWSF